MKFFSRKGKILFAFSLAVLMVGVYIASQAQIVDSVPNSFTQARLQGALISQTISTDTAKVNDDLTQVNQLDGQQSNIQNAETVVNDLVQQSQSVKTQAYQLSQQLQIMTNALPQIQSEDAQQAALAAINERLMLITHLVNYSNDLSDLLQTLKDQLSGGGTAANTSQVQNLINEINTEINSINSFNTQATNSMNQFDQIINSGH